MALKLSYIPQIQGRRKYFFILLFTETKFIFLLTEYLINIHLIMIYKLLVFGHHSLIKNIKETLFERVIQSNKALWYKIPNLVNWFT